MWLLTATLLGAIGRRPSLEHSWPAAVWGLGQGQGFLGAESGGEYGRHDRLLHHCHIVNIRGSSYRMRKHTDLSKILHSPPAESTPSPPKRKRARAKEKTTN